MAVFILRRLVYMAVTVAFVSVIAFILIQLPPGDVLTAEIQEIRAVGAVVTPEQVAALQERYGLNDPMYVQYLKWVGGFVQGDFGRSFSHHAPVAELIWSRLGLTLALTVYALVIHWVIAVPIGVYSATHRYSPQDYAISIGQFTIVSVPEFLLALVVLVVAARVFGADVGGLFSVEYQDAPWSWGKFVDLMQHMWVPAIVIAAGGTAWLTRIMRANLLDVLNQQYVQTATAKGLSERRVVWKHAVRNALHPLIMTLGTTLPVLISGEAIVSMVLNLPTAGPLLLGALVQQDMYLAGTLLIFLSILLIIGNLLADIALAWVDPRVRSAG